MAKPKKVPIDDNTVIIPVMHVFNRQWEHVGVVDDHGHRGSRALARERFGSVAEHLVPGFVEEVTV